MKTVSLLVVRDSDCYRRGVEKVKRKTVKWSSISNKQCRRDHQMRNWWCIETGAPGSTVKHGDFHLACPRSMLRIRCTESTHALSTSNKFRSAYRYVLHRNPWLAIWLMAGLAGKIPAPLSRFMRMTRGSSIDILIMFSAEPGIA